MRGVNNEYVSETPILHASTVGNPGYQIDISHANGTVFDMNTVENPRYNLEQDCNSEVSILPSKFDYGNCVDEDSVDENSYVSGITAIIEADYAWRYDRPFTFSYIPPVPTSRIPTYRKTRFYYRIRIQQGLRKHWRALLGGVSLVLLLAAVILIVLLMVPRELDTSTTLSTTTTSTTLIPTIDTTSYFCTNGFKLVEQKCWQENINFLIELTLKRIVTDSLDSPCIQFNVTGLPGKQWYSTFCDVPTSFVCELPPTINASCPNNFNMHCYSYHNESKSVLNAQDTCRSHCGNLVSIGSVRENIFVRSIIQADWIYLGRFVTSRDVIEWIDGSPNKWNNITIYDEKQTCLILNKDEGSWMTTECNGTSPFVCKVPIGKEC